MNIPTEVRIGHAGIGFCIGQLVGSIVPPEDLLIFTFGLIVMIAMGSLQRPLWPGALDARDAELEWNVAIASTLCMIVALAAAIGLWVPSAVLAYTSV